jgi:hypothetical protein
MFASEAVPRNHRAVEAVSDLETALARAEELAGVER